MKKVSLSLLLLSLFCTPALSQKTTRRDTLYLLNGDTARGLINYRRWDYKPSDISFIPEAGVKELNAIPMTFQALNTH
jgi:hypothetical protein